jgi:hypothetical protein
MNVSAEWRLDGDKETVGRKETFRSARDRPAKPLIPTLVTVWRGTPFDHMIST